MSPTATTRTPRSTTKADYVRELVLLPSARQIFAVRFTHQETRVNKHGIQSVITVTDPWPAGCTPEDVAARVRAARA